MILNHLFDSENEREELYKLRMSPRLTKKELSAHLGVDRRMAGRSKDSQITLFLSCCDSSSSAPLLSRASGAYVNLHKLPIRGTSLAESLSMRNLTRFYGLVLLALWERTLVRMTRLYLSDIALP
jgi:hypothetical protein